jgi:ABC-type Mn2+/Zn2+ transport system permease subunit
LDKFLKLVAIFIVVCAIGIFYPTYFQILANHILLGNISIVSASLAILLIVGSGIVLIYEFIFYSQNKIRISTYKMCLYLLKQAQLVVDRNGQ